MHKHNLAQIGFVLTVLWSILIPTASLFDTLSRSTETHRLDYHMLSTGFLITGGAFLILTVVLVLCIRRN